VRSILDNKTLIRSVMPSGMASVTTQIVDKLKKEKI
jgi:hypothetical protein